MHLLRAWVLAIFYIQTAAQNASTPGSQCWHSIPEWNQSFYAWMQYTLKYFFGVQVTSVDSLKWSITASLKQSIIYLLKAAKQVDEATRVVYLYYLTVFIFFNLYTVDKFHSADALNSQERAIASSCGTKCISLFLAVFFSCQYLYHF